VRKPSRRRGRAGGTGRGGSRSTGTRHEQQHHNHDDPTSALQPSSIVLDNLGMHFTSQSTDSPPFSLGDFPTADFAPRRQMQGEGSGVTAAAEDDADPWRLV
jgi:hypothetical protein